MSVRDELLKFRNSTKSKKQSLNEQGRVTNWPGVQPDKFDYRKPIPDPNILPDCFTALLKSNTNMVGFDKDSLQNEKSKRINSVDITFDPNSSSDKLGITIIKDGKPFCFIKK
jgi:hypothetical protein